MRKHISTTGAALPSQPSYYASVVKVVNKSFAGFIVEIRKNTVNGAPIKGAGYEAPAISRDIDGYQAAYKSAQGFQNHFIGLVMAGKV